MTVIFSRSDDGILSVKATDVETGSPAGIEVEVDSNQIPEHEIDAMIQEAENHRVEDQIKARQVEMHIKYENQIDSVEYFMVKYKNQMTELEKKDLKSIIDDAKKWYKDNQESDEKAYGEKQKFIYELVNIYKTKYINAPADDNQIYS